MPLKTPDILAPVAVSNGSRANTDDDALAAMFGPAGTRLDAYNLALAEIVDELLRAQTAEDAADDASTETWQPADAAPFGVVVLAHFPPSQARDPSRAWRPGAPS